MNFLQKKTILTVTWYCGLFPAISIQKVGMLRVIFYASYDCLIITSQHWMKNGMLMKLIVNCITLSTYDGSLIKCFNFQKGKEQNGVRFGLMCFSWLC